MGSEFIDLDALLVKFCITDIKVRLGVDMSGDWAALLRLSMACESAKRKLSQWNQTRVTVEALVEAERRRFGPTRGGLGPSSKGFKASRRVFCWFSQGFPSFEAVEAVFGGQRLLRGDVAELLRGVLQPRHRCAAGDLRHLPRGQSRMIHLAFCLSRSSMLAHLG